MKKIVALLMTVLLLNVFAGCSQADEIPDDPNQYVYSYDDSSAGDAAENTFDWSALIDEKLDMSVLSLDAKIESADLFQMILQNSFLCFQAHRPPMIFLRCLPPQDLRS